MKATAVLFPGLILGIGTALLVGGVVQEEFETPEPEIPIGEIHEKITAKFIDAMGFGFTRIVNFQTRKPGATRDHQLTYFIEGDEGYTFNLIGLVANPEGNVYISAAEVNRKGPQESLQSLDLAIKKLEPATTPPTALDNRAISLFSENMETRPQLLKTKGKWIGHGPIRATQAKCMKCHGVEKGALLGVFRYEFAETKE